MLWGALLGHIDRTGGSGHSVHADTGVLRQLLRCGGHIEGGQQGQCGVLGLEELALAWQEESHGKKVEDTLAVAPLPSPVSLLKPPATCEPKSLRPVMGLGSLVACCLLWTCTWECDTYWPVWLAGLTCWP